MLIDTAISAVFGIHRSTTAKHADIASEVRHTYAANSTMFNGCYGESPGSAGPIRLVH